MRGRRSTAMACAGLAVTAVMAFGATPAYAAAGGQNGTTLTATVDITPTFTKTYAWTISKSVSPAIWNLFAGDSGTSEFKVSVTKDGGTLTAKVEGSVCVTNGGDVVTENLAIANVMTEPKGSPILAGPFPVDLTAKSTLNPGESHCYPYSYAVPADLKPGVAYKDIALITITNHSGNLGTPSGPGPADSWIVPASPTEQVNNEVHVTDTKGGSWAFSDDGSVTYPRTFTKADAGTNNNTATITETEQSASASVTVNVYALKVAKTAGTSFDRAWNWTIDKAASVKSLLLASGEQVPVDYTVTVNGQSTDDNWAVNGKITIDNPAPIAATLTAVKDAMGSDSATVTCPDSLIVAAGGALECLYSMPLGSATGGTNTANVTLQNYAYDSAGVALAAGTSAYDGTAAVVFSKTPTVETDECVAVADSYAGTLSAKVCAADGAHATFTYTRNVGPYQVPGSYSVDNTATFTTNDTGVTGEDSVAIPVTVPDLGVGCTLTQGYWKTHSLRGPAPYDAAWLAVGSAGADTPFFASGKSYYGVLWTPPQGNPYYTLAHQYIAAQVNKLNGASSSAVDATLAAAGAYFATYTPTYKPSTAQKAQLTGWTTILGDYNTGLVGPGHCSE